MPESVRRVVGGDLVDLGQGWIVEDAVHEEVEPAAERNHGLADVDQFGRIGSDAVDAEQMMALAVEEHFEHTGIVAEDLTAGGFPVAGDADFVGHSIASQLLLRRAAHGKFGDRVDAIRIERPKVFGFIAKHSTCGDSTLLAAGRGKGRKPDHVAGGVDTGHVGLECLIHGDSSSVINLHAGGSEMQRLGRGASADREDHAIRNDPLAALEFEFDFGSSFFEDFHSGDGFAQPEGHIFLPHLMHQLVDDLTIHEIKQLIPAIDQRHLDASGGEDRCVFDADHAATDHRQIRREFLHLENIVGGEDQLAIAWPSRRRRGIRATGDQNVLGGDRPGTSIVGDRDAVRINEGGLAFEDGDVVSSETVPNHRGLGRDDLIDSIDEIGHLRSLPDGESIVAIAAGGREDCFSERLGGNGASEGADAAHSPSLLDQCHPLMQFGRLDRRGLAGRAATDDQKVVFVRIAHRHSLTAGGRYESGSALNRGTGC